MRVVVALGGNALLRRGEPPDADVELGHIRVAAKALAVLAAEHGLVICHGNGPQVGLLALESYSDRSLTGPYPLDALGAQTQGMIGYWLTQPLRNEGVAAPIVSVTTQTVVDADDHAFSHPSKPIGPRYTSDGARILTAKRGWTMLEDGPMWRRPVPSPRPRRLVEQDTIDLLVAAGTVVVCGGGGGIPLVENAVGTLSGVDAVVDKDHTAAHLAIAVGAERLMILTDVTSVIQHFGTVDASPLGRVHLDELDSMTFDEGSMGPKVAACKHFVETTGFPAWIGSLDHVDASFSGRLGTTLLPEIPGRSKNGGSVRGSQTPIVPAS